MMKITITLALCLVAVSNAAPYVPVVSVLPAAVVHHPAAVVHSSTVVQSHPSPVARVVTPAVVHPVAVHPVAVHPVAVHPVAVHPVAVHPVAVHPVVPVHSVVHY